MDGNAQEKLRNEIGMWCIRKREVFSIWRKVKKYVKKCRRIRERHE